MNIIIKCMLGWIHMVIQFEQITCYLACYLLIQELTTRHQHVYTLHSHRCGQNVRKIIIFLTQVHLPISTYTHQYPYLYIQAFCLMFSTHPTIANKVSIQKCALVIIHTSNWIHTGWCYMTRVQVSLPMHPGLLHIFPA